MRTYAGAFGRNAAYAENRCDCRPESCADAAQADYARRARQAEAGDPMDELARVKSVVGESFGNGEPNLRGNTQRRKAIAKFRERRYTALHQCNGESIGGRGSSTGIFGIGIGKGTFQLASRDERSQASVVRTGFLVATECVGHAKANTLSRDCLSAVAKDVHIPAGVIHLLCLNRKNPDSTP